MKFVSWNVNGIRAAVTKDFKQIFADLNADFFCVQETKVQAGQIDLAFPGYQSFWNYAERKGYSGTAIFCRQEPIAQHYTLNGENFHEGRSIALEFDDFFLVTVYTPNIQAELARAEFRQHWDDAFLAYMKHLDAQKPVIICGDFNVAHKDIDLKYPDEARGTAGFSDQERFCFDRLLQSGFTDTFRHLHPEATGIYSWWSYQNFARKRNDGWRIDYFLVSDRIADRVAGAEILTKIKGSDHAPVVLELN